MAKQTPVAPQFDGDRELITRLKDTLKNREPVPRLTPDDIMRVRLRFGLSQDMYAKVLVVSTSSVMRWEHGFSQPYPQARQRILKLDQYADEEGYPQVSDEDLEAARRTRNRKRRIAA